MTDPTNRSLILIESGHTEEGPLIKFMQECARWNNLMPAFSFYYFGISNEYTFYDASGLTKDELAIIALKFSAAKVIPSRPDNCSSGDLFKQAMGYDYYN